MLESYPSVLTSREVTDVLRISCTTLYRMIKRGEINSTYRKGHHHLFKKQDIINWLEEHEDAKSQNKQ
jgi:excisionase family DNA binding protein